MWYVEHETRGVVPLPFCSGTCQEQALPERHNPSYKTLLSFSTSAFEVQSRTKRKPLPKSNMQLPRWPDKMSVFHGKRTEKFAKKNQAFLFGRQVLLHFNRHKLRSGNASRHAGRVVRTRPKKFMKMSKMILLK